MKRFIAGIAAAVFLTLPSAAVCAEGDIGVVLDGGRINFDVSPVIINERTMVPVRAIFEALGAEVAWDDETKTVSAHKGDTNISLAIGSDVMYRGEEEIALDSPAVIIDSRTLVPVRAISEAFGGTVEWDDGSRTVVITSDGYSGEVYIPEQHYSLSLDDIPAYYGEASIALNNNIPAFSDAELTTDVFEVYSDLDELGRCGVAYANVCREIMPAEERGSIGQIKPTGWHTVRYDFIDGNYLYNRCHLIGYQLAGENANEKNLITGTRYLNTEGMLPFENAAADYVNATNNHVLYRVTPVFVGDNLLPLGVQMEAKSVEDNGAGVSFNVFCYNVEPGIIIDYATGDNWSDGTFDQQPAQSEAYDNAGAYEPANGYTFTAAVTGTYILNTNTKKFHYPGCSSVKKMKEKNKSVYTGSRDDVISMGYNPCRICKP